MKQKFIRAKDFLDMMELKNNNFNLIYTPSATNGQSDYGAAPQRDTIASGTMG